MEESVDRVTVKLPTTIEPGRSGLYLPLRRPPTARRELATMAPASGASEEYKWLWGNRGEETVPTRRRQITSDYGSSTEFRAERQLPRPSFTQTQRTQIDNQRWSQHQEESRKDGTCRKKLVVDHSDLDELINQAIPTIPGDNSDSVSIVSNGSAHLSEDAEAFTATTSNPIRKALTNDKARIDSLIKRKPDRSINKWHSLTVCNDDDAHEIDCNSWVGTGAEVHEYHGGHLRNQEAEEADQQASRMRGRTQASRSQPRDQPELATVHRSLAEDDHRSASTKSRRKLPSLVSVLNTTSNTVSKLKSGSVVNKMSLAQIKEELSAVDRSISAIRTLPTRTTAEVSSKATAADSRSSQQVPAEQRRPRQRSSTTRTYEEPDDHRTPRMETSPRKRRDPSSEAVRKESDYDSDGDRDFKRNTVWRRQRSREYPMYSDNSDDSSIDRNKSRHPKSAIKPVKFDGTSSFETFYAHFVNCAHYNVWRKSDQLAHLKACLTGEAGQVLWDNSPEVIDSLSKLVHVLKQRFSGTSQADKHRIELRLRRRRASEPLTALHSDIRRLMALVYPRLPHEARETIACDHFVDSLDDPELALKVRERNPSSLDSALSAALQLEAWNKEASRARDSEHKLAKGHGGRGVVSATSTELTDLTGQLKKLTERISHLENSKGLPPSQQTPAADSIETSRQVKPTILRDSSNRWSPTVRPTSTLTTPPDGVGEFRQQISGQRASEPITTPWTRETQARPEQTGCWICGDPNHYKRRCPQNRWVRNNLIDGTRAITRGSGSLLDQSEVYLRMELLGQSLPCLVDSGCEISLVPHSIVTQHRELRIMPTEERIFAANGTAIDVVGEVVLPLILEEQQLNTRALISNDIEELMLGADWLRQFRCVWDFGKNQLYVAGRLAIPMTQRRQVRCRRVYLQTDVVLPPRQQTDVLARATVSSLRHGVEHFAIDPRRLQAGVYVGRTLVPPTNHDLRIRLLNTMKEPQAISGGTYLGKLEPVELSGFEENTDTDNNSLPIEIKESLMSHLPDELDTRQREEVAVLLDRYADVFSHGEHDIGHTTLVEHRIDTGDHRPIRQPLRRHPVAYLEEIDSQVEEMVKHGIAEPAASPWSSNLVLVRKKDGSQRVCNDYRQINSITYKDTYPLPHIDTCLDALSGSSWFSTLDLRAGYHNIPVAKEDRDKTAFITRRGCFRYRVMPYGLTTSPSVFQRLMDMTLCGLSYETCLIYMDDVIVMAHSFEEQLQRLETVFQRLRLARLKLKATKCRLFQRRVAFLGHVVSADGLEMQREKIAAIIDWPRPTNVSEVRYFCGLAAYYRKFVKDFSQIAGPLYKLMQKNHTFRWEAEQQLAFDQLKIKLTSEPVLGLPRNLGDYVLDTDASDAALGTVLSQMQDGKERVLAYGSRLLSQAEKNYSVTKRELLAVVFGLKQYRQYLIGRSFTIRTDCSALSWLRSTPEPMAQQARWLTYIEAFDYRVVHRPGARHCNADALSRRPAGIDQCTSPITPRAGNTQLNHNRHHIVSSITRQSLNEANTANSNNSDKIETTALQSPRLPMREEEPAEWLSNLQSSDPEIGYIVQLRKQQDVMPEIQEVITASAASKRWWSQWFSLVVKEGVVYRKMESKQGRASILQLLAPISMRNQIIEQSHTGMTGAHLGVFKTQDQVRRRAVWIGWRSDVKRYIRRCSNCCQYFRGKLPRSAPLQPIVAGAPWERLSYDLTGAHTRSASGNVYILTCIDPYTKWAEAYPIRNKEAITVARVMVEKIFVKFGCPIALLSDCGTEVDSRIMKEICALLHIDKMRTTPYKASTNAAAERFHRTLNAMIGRVVSEHQRDWDTYLPYIMAAYRSARHESTGYSPNMLMLGRELRAPIDIVLGTGELTGEITNYDEFVENVKDRMMEAHALVREHLRASALRAKHYYDLRVRPQKYSVGCWVYCWQQRRFSGRQDKWARKYKGPFCVIKVVGPVNVLIQKTEKAKPFLVHIDKLKLYEGEPPKNWLREGIVEEGPRINQENDQRETRESTSQATPKIDLPSISCELSVPGLTSKGSQDPMKLEPTTTITNSQTLELEEVITSSGGRMDDDTGNNVSHRLDRPKRSIKPPQRYRN